MKQTRTFLSACAIAAALAGSLPGQANKLCYKISGVATESIVPPDAAPNDPFGRVIGTFAGDFGGAGNASLSAALTSPPAFNPPGSTTTQTIQVRHVFTTGPGDAVTTRGTAAFNVVSAAQAGSVQPTPSRCPGTPCIVQVPQSLEIVTGTGRWAGASGTLQNMGVGDLNLPMGQGVFTIQVKGEVCVPATRVLGRATPQQ
jgi:hypothetical protein